MESGINCTNALRPICTVSVNLVRFVSVIVTGRVASLNALLKSLIFRGVLPVKSVFFSPQENNNTRQKIKVPLRI